MSPNLVPVSQTLSPLEMLMAASVPAEGRKAALASTPLQAVNQAHDLFAGYYVKLWEASDNSPMAWLIGLGDATPDEIAAAAVAYLRDTSRDANGELHCHYPPKPGHLRAWIEAQRTKLQRDADRRAAEREKAVRMVHEVAGLKSCGRWDAMPQEQRANLEGWAAYGEKVIAEREREATAKDRGREVASLVGNLVEKVTAPADAPKRPNPAPAVAGCAIVLAGILLGHWLGSFRVVQAARSDAVEFARSVAPSRFASDYAVNLSSLGVTLDTGAR